MSKLDMAKSMGLISDSEYGGYRAKNFAVFMFAERPNKFISQAHVEIIREAVGTDIDDYTMAVMYINEEFSII